jgi:hypothetical protein
MARRVAQESTLNCEGKRQNDNDVEWKTSKKKAATLLQVDATKTR